MSVNKTESVKKVDLDDVLDKYGIFRRYHVEIICLVFLAFLTNSWYCSNFVFAAEEVTYRCKDDEEGAHKCAANTTHSCTEWIYDDPDSFVAYFDLACQEWKRTLVGTVHSFGYMCGLLLVGPMSDRLYPAHSRKGTGNLVLKQSVCFVLSSIVFAAHAMIEFLSPIFSHLGVGRKNTAVVLGVLGGIFGVLRSFSVWYWFYIAMEFFEAAIGDVCSPLFVLALEIVSTKKRLKFYMMCCFGYVFGGVTVSIIAWLVPNWRWFLRALYVPAFLFISYKYLLDESPRWLLTKGRKDEAITILENAAKKNKMQFDKNILDKLTCEVSPNVKFSQLIRDTFSSKQLRRRFFVCLSWWVTSTFVNYGLMINSVTLQGNKYINFGLTSLVDLPGNLLITYILIYFKRKLPLMLSFFAGALLCISQPFLPTNLPWLSIAFYMASKMMCCFFFSITYIYTSELFPTYTRNSMHALCSSFGRIGSIIAPQTPLLIAYGSGLPSLVFGLSALLAGFTTFLVPDISNDSLPDTVHQAETFGKSKKSVEMHNEDIRSNPQL